MQERAWWWDALREVATLVVILLAIQGLFIYVYEPMELGQLLAVAAGGSLGVAFWTWRRRRTAVLRSEAVRGPDTAA